MTGFSWKSPTSVEIHPTRPYIDLKTSHTQRSCKASQTAPFGCGFQTNNKKKSHIHTNRMHRNMQLIYEVFQCLCSQLYGWDVNWEITRRHSVTHFLTFHQKAGTAWHYIKRCTVDSDSWRHSTPLTWLSTGCSFLVCAFHTFKKKEKRKTCYSLCRSLAHWELCNFGANRFPSYYLKSNTFPMR